MLKINNNLFAKNVVHIHICTTIFYTGVTQNIQNSQITQKIAHFTDENMKHEFVRQLYIFKVRIDLGYDPYRRSCS